MPPVFSGGIPSNCEPSDISPASPLTVLSYVLRSLFFCSVKKQKLNSRFNGPSPLSASIRLVDTIVKRGFEFEE